MVKTLAPNQPDSEENFKDPIQPDIGPDTHNFNLPDGGPGPDRAAGDPSDPRGGLDDIRHKEKNGAGKEDGLASPDFDEEAPGSKGNKRRRFRITRRRAAVISIGATGAVAAMIGFFSVSSGPLEFVHIAQLMEKFHFSAQQDAEDGRLTKIARYIRDPSKPQNTRLGFVGNKIANHLETKLNEATGLSSDYNELTGQFNGYKVDKTSKVFEGKTDNREIIQQLKDTYPGITEANLTVDPTTGDITIDPTATKSNSVTRYLAQTRFARTLLGAAGYSKLSARLGARVLADRANWTFHPIQEWESNYRATLITGGKSLYDKAKQAAQDKFFSDVEGTVEPPGGTPSGEQKNANTNKNLTPAEKATANANADGVNGIKQVSSTEQPQDPTTIDKASASLTAKVSGGGAALIGVICVMHSIDQNVKHERQVKVILPMMHFASQIISIGSQVQSGQDLSAVQLGTYKDFLDGTDSKGNITTWNQAQSIQAELGQQQTGPDIPKAAQVFNSDVPFSAIEGPVTDAACSVLGSIFGQIFSIVTAPVTTIIQSQILGTLVDSLANWLSGAPVNIKTGAGATDGNYLNYGSRALAGDQYASAGGVALNSSDEAQIKGTHAFLDNQDFKSKSFAYRIFNVDDSQTLASKVMDNYGSSGVAQGFASILHNFGSIFSSALRAPASLLSGVTHAANKPYDYHGLNMVGFTEEDLANPAFDNPFQNGCDVVGGCTKPDGTPIPPAANQSILGGPNGSMYMDRVSKCFGDTITSDSSGWSVSYGTATVETYGSDYAANNCNDRSMDWLHVRFWILDTQTMEGYDCSQSVTQTAPQSCTDIGFGSSSSSSSSATTSTAGATLDTAHLADSSVNVACAPNTNDIGVYDGYTNGNPVKIRLCAISNLPSTGSEANGGYGVTGANGKCPLNSRVSGAVYQMVQAAQQSGVTLTTDSCFRTMAHQQALQGGPNAAATPGYSNHQLGLAMDFSVPKCDAIINGQCSDPGNPMWDWLHKNAGKFGYKSGVSSEAWHWSPSGN